MIFAFVAVAILSLRQVLGAPTPSALDAATLQQNGLDAQTLNAEFSQIKSSDPCDSGQLACVEGARAQCQFGAWTTQKCVDSQKCFAVPNVNSKGTSLVCTSEATALSLFNATGVQGGLTASNGTNTTMPLPTVSPQSASVSSTSITSSPSATSSSVADNAEVVTVTVTVITSSQPTFTLPPETSILNPTQASSLVSSLGVNGFTTTPNTPSSTSSVLPTVTATPAAAAASNGDSGDDSDCTDDDTDSVSGSVNSSSSDDSDGDCEGDAQTSAASTSQSTPAAAATSTAAAITQAVVSTSASAVSASATAAADPYAGYKRRLIRLNRRGIWRA
ncbi:hypothetical protein C8Q75DRAFT_806441 [Abortiporus biennis]|nr:hypothetical protein C8Q75DRAFT_806441 [Abortiporus biennis]